jgi:3-oxoacyl-[acyl-carrier protein] reductase
MSGTPVAIVTGAGKGIGRSVALGFARRDHHVIANARTRGDLDTLSAEIAVLGGRCEAIAGDVADPALSEMLEKAARGLGRCDVLVNCAGMQPPVNEIENVPLEDWFAALAVNLTGPYLTCRAIVPMMKARGRGRIVNVASGLAVHVQPGQTPYSAAKAGLVQLSAVLAAEAAPHGVTVVSAHPGIVDTDIVRQNLADTRPGLAGAMIRRLEHLRANGLLITPEQSARFLVWLAHAEIEPGRFARADDPAHARAVAEFWDGTAG